MATLLSTWHFKSGITRSSGILKRRAMNSNAGGSLVEVCGVFRYIIRNIFKLSLSDNSPFIARRAFLTFHKSFYNSVTIEGCHGAVVDV